MNKIAIWTLSIVSLGLVACGGKKEETPAEMEMHQQAMGETYVDTMTLHTSTFNKQIVCNGRLRAKAMSELNQLVIFFWWVVVPIEVVFHKRYFL